MHFRAGSPSAKPAGSPGGVVANELLVSWQSAANDAAETLDRQPWSPLLLFEDDLSHGGSGKILLGGLVNDPDFVAVANQTSDLLESHVVRILRVVELPV